MRDMLIYTHKITNRTTVSKEDMDMRFYYNGQLIRTSKNHHYTYACISIGKDGKYICQGCSSTKAGAEKVKKEVVTRFENGIFSAKARIEALKAGKKGYYSRKHEWISFKTYDLGTIEDNERWLEYDSAKLEEVKQWKIVELIEEA